MEQLLRWTWVLAFVVNGLFSVAEAQSRKECVDKEPLLCKILADRGNCSSNQREMLQLCPLSCRFCNPTSRPSSGASSGPALRPNSRPTITKPSFSCGVPVVSRRTPNGQRGSSSLSFTRDFNRPRNPSGSLPSRRRREANPQLGTSQSTKTEDSTSTTAPVKLSIKDTFCGATPISDRFLLTAAYCVFDPDHPLSSVRLGELDFSKENETNSRPRDYNIETIFVHPDYDPTSPVRYNDIALLQTSEKIEFNKVVFPYCVAGVRPPADAWVTGSGFGLVNETHKSPILQEADLKIMSSARCEEVYEERNQKQQLQVPYPKLLQGRDVMCAGYEGRGLCKGDEGGPLSLKNKQGQLYLVGIASYAGSCEKESIMPGIFTSVADHIDFINSILYEQH